MVRFLITLLLMYFYSFTWSLVNVVIDIKGDIDAGSRIDVRGLLTWSTSTRSLSSFNYTVGKIIFVNVRENDKLQLSIGL